MLYGLLLAGGKSLRMGEDKKQLVYNGKTLLAHATALLEEAGADRILLSGDIEGHTSIPDINPASGPPGGVHSAVSFLSGEPGFEGSMLLVIPVDMPLLEPPTLSRLLKYISSDAACHYEDEIFPCLFRLSNEFRAHLDRIFDEGTGKGGSRSMRALLDFCDAVTLESRGISRMEFLNLNTQADWQEFLSMQKSDQ